MAYKSSNLRKLYLVFNHTFSIIVTLACLLPIIHVLSLSLSSKENIIAGFVTLWPRGLTFDNYRYVARDSQFYTSFKISVLRTILALLIQMLLTVLAAYPLSISKQKFAARQFYVWFFIVTILFSGGLIPTYIVVMKTGLINRIWSLVIPNALPVFNVILLQNYIKVAIPDSLSESASLDGANHFRIMWSIYLPLCTPVVATLCLFVMVGNWNAWFDGMIYINDNLKFPLQTYLRSIIVEVDLTQMSDITDIANRVAMVGTNTAKIFVAMVPILCVYPFIQRHFVSGIVLGSVKE